MGFKLNSNIAPLNCFLKDGVIYVLFGNEAIKEIKTNIPKSVYIGKKCNFWDMEGDILCYIRNKSYFLVLRGDGSLNLFTTDNVLIYSEYLDLNEIKENVELTLCGSIIVKNIIEPCFLAEYSGKYFLFSNKIPICLLLNTNGNPVNVDIISWSHKYKDAGTLRISDMNSKDNKSYYVNFGSKEYFKIETIDVFYSNGFIGGIV